MLKRLLPQFSPADLERIMKANRKKTLCVFNEIMRELLQNIYSIPTSWNTVQLITYFSEAFGTLLDEIFNAPAEASSHSTLTQFALDTSALIKILPHEPFIQQHQYLNILGNKWRNIIGDDVAKLMHVLRKLNSNNASILISFLGGSERVVKHIIKDASSLWSLLKFSTGSGRLTPETLIKMLAKNLGDIDFSTKIELSAEDLHYHKSSCDLISQLIGSTQWYQARSASAPRLT